nr:hypothetical protein [Tolivirales sp.]
MAPTKKNAKGRKSAARKQVRVARPRVVDDNELKLLRLIMDPCSADLVNGYALSTRGVVQRYSSVFSITGTNTTQGAVAIFPCDYAGGAIRMYSSTASSTALPTPVVRPLPGQAAIDAVADNVTTLAACVQVIYTGTELDRKGYIGVGQGPFGGLLDTFVTTGPGPANFDNVLASCQMVTRTPDSPVELKWSPTVSNFNGGQGVEEAGYSTSNNGLFFVVNGIPTTDYMFKVTVVYEWMPKATIGMPLPPVGRTIRPGTAERITSALNSAGMWWNNLMQLGGATSSMLEMAGRGANRIGKAAYSNRALLAPATTAMLALTG